MDAQLLTKGCLLAISVMLVIPAAAGAADRADTSVSLVRIDYRDHIVQLESERKECTRKREVRLVLPDRDPKKFTHRRGTTRFELVVDEGAPDPLATGVRVPRTARCKSGSARLDMKLVPTYLTSQHFDGPPAEFSGRLTSEHPERFRKAVVLAARRNTSGLSAYGVTDRHGYWRDAFQSLDADWPPGDYLTEAFLELIAYSEFAKNGNASVGICARPEPVWVTVD